MTESASLPAALRSPPTDRHAAGGGEPGLHLPVVPTVPVLASQVRKYEVD